MSQPRFDRLFLPVAYPMVHLASPDREPLQRYMCYWIAFNNIYRVVTERYSSERPAYRRDESNLVKFSRPKTGDDLLLPEVDTVAEWKQIKQARLLFGSELKQRLIDHPSTAYFVNRVPRLYGEEIRRDSQGQELNGVLKMGETLSREYPVWSPIDKKVYQRYLDGDRSTKTVDTLIRQIVAVLYTVRNNLFHGGKEANNESDREVLEHALPLLAMIVESFMELGSRHD